jgi:hypothetical protein
VTGRILRSAGTARKIRSLPGTVPSLKEFVHKTQVLKQYRSFLRAIRLMDNEEDRQDAYQEVKRAFKTHSVLQDTMGKQMAVTEGERQLQQVQSLTGASVSVAHKKDSWLDTHHEEDQRGRVGTDWPWQRREV